MAGELIAQGGMKACFGIEMFSILTRVVTGEIDMLSKLIKPGHIIHLLCKLYHELIKHEKTNNTWK